MKRLLVLTSVLVGPAVLVPGVALADAPANDRAVAAQPIGELPAFLSGTTGQATLDDDEPAPLVANDDDGRQHGLDKSVWYSYTPAGDRTLIADTCDANFTSHIDVYAITPAGGSLLRTKSNDYRDCPGDRRSFGVNVGTSYLIRVTAQRDGVRVPDGGVFHLKVTALTPPPNDAFAEAAVLPGTGDTLAHLAFSTLELGEPAFEGDTGSVWYRLAPTVSRPYTAAVAASASQVTLTAFESRGATINRLRRLAADSTETESAASVSFNALRGHTYYLRLGTAAKVSGDAQLSLTTNTASGLGLLITPSTNTLQSVRSRGLSAVLSCARACRLGVDLLVAPADARRYKLIKGKPTRPVRVGHVGGTLGEGAPTPVTIPISSAEVRRRLARAPAVHFLLRVAIRARGAGNPVTKAILVRR